MSTKVKVHRISSDISGVREWSKGDETCCRVAVNRAEEVELRKINRFKDKRIQNSLEESEGRMYRMVAKLQVFLRDKEYFYHRIEDLGVLGR